MAQGKANFFEDNPDIAFHLEKRMDMQALFNLLSEDEKAAISVANAKEYLESWTGVLSAMGEVAGTEIAKNALNVEKEHLNLDAQGNVTPGPALKQNIEKLLELGASSLGISPKYGGLGASFFVEGIATELLYRACPSTYLNMCWYSSIAHIIDMFGNDEQREAYIPRIATGEWSGSMALTEPDAGSDLSALRTYGELQPDGTWKVFGSKRFISNGFGQISLVLAKNSKGAKELKDLNLFIVRKMIDDQPNFLVTKLEEKIGLHGSATCELQFDGSKAELLGKDGQGFRYMLHLMNDARIAVGMQGIGLMEASFRLANEYAQQRKTWGKPIAQHERIAEMLLDMEVELKAFRSLAFQGLYHQSLVVSGERRLKDPSLSEKDKKELEDKLVVWRKRIRRWTPLIKWWVGEKSYQHARNCLQIHGGYGFSTEYRAEWWVRESLILSLYEGTSQIQALMCIKDTMKDIIRKPTEFIEEALGTRVRTFAQGDPIFRKLYRCRQTVNSAIIALLFQLVKVNVRASLSTTSSKDILRILKIISRDLVKFENIGPALLHAERVTEMKALVSIANQACLDYRREPSRRWIAERFVNKALIRINSLKEEIEMDTVPVGKGVANLQSKAEVAGG